MALTTKFACPHCGRENAGTALLCGLCGGLIRREVGTPALSTTPLSTEPPLPKTQRPPARFTMTEVDPNAPPEPADPLDAKTWGIPSRWFCLIVGLVVAQVFAIGSASWFGWFLSSLAHEMGHSCAALLTGIPAIPAIRLDGHAMAMHGEQSIPLAIIVWSALGYAVWFLRERKVFAIPLAALVLVAPLLAFTTATYIFIGVMGHGGELVFAGVCFTRVFTGCSFTRGEIERVLYSVVAWYLVVKNTLLFWGLATSPDALLNYYGNGSFGLRNDFDRLANDHLGMPIETLAFMMLVPCLAVLPIAYAAYRVRRTVGEH